MEICPACENEEISDIDISEQLEKNTKQKRILNERQGDLKKKFVGLTKMMKEVIELIQRFITWTQMMEHVIEWIQRFVRLT